MVDDRTCVKSGERVTVMQGDVAGFSEVQASNGTRGYIQSEYLRPLAPSAPPAAAPPPGMSRR
jgi:uncharacterized protein YgiM (DUF1202 family)